MQHMPDTVNFHSLRIVRCWIPAPYSGLHLSDRIPALSTLRSQIPAPDDSKRMEIDSNVYLATPIFCHTAVLYYAKLPLFHGRNFLLYH